MKSATATAVSLATIDVSICEELTHERAPRPEWIITIRF